MQADRPASQQGRLSAGEPQKATSQPSAALRSSPRVPQQQQQHQLPSAAAHHSPLDKDGSQAGDGHRKRLLPEGFGAGHAAAARPRKHSRRKHRQGSPARSVGSGASSSGFHGAGDRSFSVMQPSHDLARTAAAAARDAHHANKVARTSAGRCTAAAGSGDVEMMAAPVAGTEDDGGLSQPEQAALEQLVAAGLPGAAGMGLAAAAAAGGAANPNTDDAGSGQVGHTAGPSSGSGGSAGPAERLCVNDVEGEGEREWGKEWQREKKSE
eukprot:gene5856-6097_t